MDDRLARILCCLPRRDALTRAVMSAGLLTYGVVEDKAWARWFGIAGLVVTGYGVVNCFRQLADEQPRDERRRLSPAAVGDSNGGGADLRLVPADQEPA